MQNIDDSLEEIFEAATNYVRLKVQQISKDNLLFFYARFKHATEGSCNTARPGGLFNFEAKSKWDGKHEDSSVSTNSVLSLHQLIKPGIMSRILARMRRWANM